MKQTVLTENNINATIDIPIEKLVTKNPHTPYRTAQEYESHVTIVPNMCCHTCCSSNKNMVSSEMIRELEIAYRDDVKELKG